MNRNSQITKEQLSNAYVGNRPHAFYTADGYAYCNIDLIRRIGNNECAKIITNRSRWASIFTLQGYWKHGFSQNGQESFCFRSDHFPGGITAQAKRMVAMARKYRDRTKTMTLYDNRRWKDTSAMDVADETIVFRWANGKLVEKNFPFLDENLSIANAPKKLLEYVEKQNEFLKPDEALEYFELITKVNAA